MKTRLAIFFTGGTISMRIDPATGGAVPALSGEEIIAQVPGLDEIADFDVINFGRWPGPHVTPSRMMELARAVKEKIAEESITGRRHARHRHARRDRISARSGVERREADSLRRGNAQQLGAELGRS